MAMGGPEEPLHYAEAGAGSPLLLVHGGFGDGAGTWARQLGTLAGRHRLLVPDRRGHGRSPAAPMPYTIRGDAQDVLAVADLAGAARFHLAGHSYGGLVALETALLAPARVLSLHLLEPPYLALLPTDPVVLALDGAVRRVVAEGPGRGPEWTAGEFFRAVAGDDAARRLRESPRWPAVAREAGRIFREEYAGDYPDERAARLELDGPVAVYTGARSAESLRRVAARLSTVLRGARLVEVPDAGHAVQAIPAFDRVLLEVTRRL